MEKNNEEIKGFADPEYKGIEQSDKTNFSCSNKKIAIIVGIIVLLGIIIGTTIIVIIIIKKKNEEKPIKPKVNDFQIKLEFQIDSELLGSKVTCLSFEELTTNDTEFYVDGNKEPFSTSYTFTTKGKHTVGYRFNKTIKDCLAMFERVYYATFISLNFSTSEVTDMRYMFSETYRLSSIDFGNFSTENVINMTAMFFYFSYNGNCSKLDFSSFDTHNLVRMDSMFQHARIKNIDLSSFDTRNVEYMDRMFQSAEVYSIYIPNWNLSKVKSLSDIFSFSFVQNLNISGWNTEQVTDMTYFLEGCYFLKILDMSNFKTNKVITFFEAFSKLKSLSSLNLTCFKTDNLISVKRMFEETKNIVIDCSSFNLINCCNYEDMFRNCGKDLHIILSQASYLLISSHENSYIDNVSVEIKK